MIVQTAVAAFRGAECQQGPVFQHSARVRASWSDCATAAGNHLQNGAEILGRLQFCRLELNVAGEYNRKCCRNELPEAWYDHYADG